ncbi:hypothetical protein TNCV_213401 [Trichonephila clavipes]|nr:hypothetical protein TNCV_213401 [Trichonephila clavipes]
MSEEDTFLAHNNRITVRNSARDYFSRRLAITVALTDLILSDRTTGVKQKVSCVYLLTNRTTQTLAEGTKRSGMIGGIRFDHLYSDIAIS